MTGMSAAEARAEEIKAAQSAARQETRKPSRLAAAMKSAQDAPTGRPEAPSGRERPSPRRKPQPAKPKSAAKPRAAKPAAEKLGRVSGQVVRDALAELGLTRSQMAEACGFSQSRAAEATNLVPPPSWRGVDRRLTTRQWADVEPKLRAFAAGLK